MALYLFRHGEAFQIGEEGIVTDSERFLTPKGMSNTKEVCEGLKNQDAHAEEIWSSPLVRAKQTAKIVAESFGVKDVAVKEGLAYVDSEEAVFKSLSKIHPDRNLFLVGHQPYLGEWVCRLVSGRRGGSVELKKSGVARVDLYTGVKPPRGSLRWLLTSRQLRKLA